MSAPTVAPPGIGHLLARVGQATSTALSARLAPLGIRPKHASLLAALSAGPAGSQSDLGLAIGVAPSAVVGILDDLEAVGAVARVADPTSRRRFVVEITASGRALLAHAQQIEDDVDFEMLGSLTAPQVAALHDALELVARAHGMIADHPAVDPGAS
ncbi:MarR family winged helix-turn-helix transcriptional regulator [Galbitalea soli]|uniref:Winged helix-turn-helix transcriptional regulator n=1 Tax=Galbitalea soli TaxID=1268042 RepID=A0A7C9PNX9_9MICO|nr:MarR family winged helix-turn-helix transcriptional regulator [Galbitalea soli]NEM91945.1 winged helix-turn-helix transcriptional regulator [Galbitalea soli]NYJ32107.1 DNA-binding MarR family transcriptional regulator [Galbitalea soli]